MLLISDLAFGATDVDLLEAAVQEKGNDISIVPNAFMSLPSYIFPPPSTITAPVRELTLSSSCYSVTVTPLLLKRRPIIEMQWDGMLSSGGNAMLIMFIRYYFGLTVMLICYINIIIVY